MSAPALPGLAGRILSERGPERSSVTLSLPRLPGSRSLTQDGNELSRVGVYQESGVGLRGLCASTTYYCWSEGLWGQKCNSRGIPDLQTHWVRSLVASFYLREERQKAGPASSRKAATV